jgi:hypothetical protein
MSPVTDMTDYVTVDLIGSSSSRVRNAEEDTLPLVPLIGVRKTRYLVEEHDREITLETYDHPHVNRRTR